jgi:hypothetical protein
MLVLEDLTEAAAAPVLAAGMGEAELAATLRSLAAVHSVAWVGPGTPVVQALAPLHPAAFEPLIAEQLPRFIEALAPHGRRLLGETRWGQITEQLQGLAAASHRASPPRAVVHGDVWTGNVLCKEAGPAGEVATAWLVDFQFAAQGNPMADIAMLIASSAELETMDARGKACRQLVEGYTAELERCFLLRGEVPPADASAEALLGPELASSGLALVVASFDTWWGMDETPAACTRLAERWVAVCVDAALHITLDAHLCSMMIEISLECPFWFLRLRFLSFCFFAFL